MTKEDFLLLDFKERDTLEFRRKFAEFLADETQCHDELVRACFDAEEEAYMARQRKRLCQECDRHLRPAQSEAFSKEMSRLREEFRVQHHAKLIDELAKRHPFDQLRYLNLYLREHDLLPTEPVINSAQERTAKRLYLTTIKPRKIYHQDVQENFYENDPRNLEHGRAKQKLLAEELGEPLAAKFTKARGIPGDGFYLSEVSEALRCLRPRAKAQSARTFHKKNYLVRALKAACVKDPEPLREFIAYAIRLHLRSIHARKQRQPEQLARIVRRKIHQLGRNYWRIYCLASGNPEIVEAVSDFFFHGLPVGELRCRPGLLAKLPLEDDIKILCDFLFNTAADPRKSPKGLIAHWVEDDEPGSVHRREKAWADTPKLVARMEAQGKKDFEIVDRVESLAGAQSIKAQTEKKFAGFDPTSSTAALERNSIEEEVREKRVEAAKKTQKRLFERALPSRRTKSA